KKIDTTVNRLNQETLTSANMENLKSSMEHLNQATGALAESSKKLDGVIGQADSTMASAKKAADNLQNAIADTRKVLQSATQGKGLVATLLNDQQLANDLHALISNLRAHGVLFYRDSAATTQTKPPEQTKPASQSRTHNDCTLRNIQLVGQKTSQSCVSFSFHSRRAQFNLNRAVMFARDLVDLPVWNNVKTQCRHRRIVAQFASRAVAFSTRMIAALLL